MTIEQSAEMREKFLCTAKKIINALKKALGEGSEVELIVENTHRILISLKKEGNNNLNKIEVESLLDDASSNLSRVLSDYRLSAEDLIRFLKEE